MSSFRRRVLVSAPYFQPVLSNFLDLFTAHNIDTAVPVVNERLSEEELLPLVSDIDGAICGDDAFTDRVLAAAPRLKVIAKWGTGVDSIDLAACQRRGIAVRNTPGAFSDPVADTVIGYMLCFARRLIEMDREMKGGRWTKIPGATLAEGTLGVIGVGNAGSMVVRRARAFGMRVLGVDIREIPKMFVAETGLEVTEQSQLLHEADFVSINCDLNPTSHHLIGARELEQMRSTAVLINTARGPVVDEVALVDALTRKAIAGAALDVFEDEPLPLSSSLLSMSNVLLAPHNANSSPRAWTATHESTVRQLLEELEKGSS